MIVTLRQLFSLPDAKPSEEIFICFDDIYAYVASPSTLWRIDRAFNASSTATILAAGTGDITHLYAERDGLYLLKNRGKDGHTFLRSRNHGASFDPLDSGLFVGDGGARAALVPTRMIRDDRGLIINAGGGINVMVSVDDAASWKLLRGSLGTQTCYPGKFKLIGTELFLGGECPLDSAYLMKGVLTRDLTRWVAIPSSVAPIDISNRNVQFIINVDEWGMLFAGVEGGLLASNTNGAQWNWSLRMKVGDLCYPYVERCVRIPNTSDAAIIGGFDKANDARPYLAVTKDRGATWIDVSGTLDALGRAVRALQEIVVHPDGRVLIGTFDPKQSEIIICEVMFQNVSA